MTSYGLALVDFGETRSKDHIERLCDVAKHAVAPGRIVAVCWEVAHTWHATEPIEAWVLESIIGPAERRSEPAQHDFFGNLVVRTYADDPIRPKRTFNVLLTRSVGEPAYRRSKDPDAPLGDRYNSRASSFTRDVANNTWHLSDRNAVSSILARLAMITRWSDEPVLLLNPNEATTLTGRVTACSEDLVGVPERYVYEWRPETGLAQLQLDDVTIA